MRYRWVATLGEGGMAVVHRVHDLQLDRSVAMKVTHLGVDAEVSRSFRAEARVAALVQHPVCVPVYDIGELPDGRPFYTMREVQFQRLHEAIQDVHARSSLAGWGTSFEGLNLRTLIRALEQVARAVSFAHQLGILHQDVKPGNIQLGRFREIQLLDWGIAMWVDRPEAESPGRPGAGTLGYLAPEARRRRPTPQSDIFSLGATLLEILTGRQPPEDLSFGGDLVPEALAQAEVSAPPLPAELAELCRRATAIEPSTRPRSAEAFANELSAWLDGARRREASQRIVDEAVVLIGELTERRDASEKARATAEQAAEGIPTHAPVAEWRPAWSDADRAERLEREAGVLSARIEQKLSSAIEHDPDNEEARLRLARHYQEQLNGAEAVGDIAATDRLSVLLRGAHPGLWRDWAESGAMISLQTDPPGATVRLSAYELVDRQLVPVPRGELGTTPLVRVPAPTGSLLLEIESPGGTLVRYPVLLRRGEHHDDYASHDGPNGALYLPREHELGVDDVYVPGGWMIAGDPLAVGGRRRRRIWVDGFVIRRFPVTHAEYLAFLRDAGRDAHDGRHRAPRDPAGRLVASREFTHGADGWRAGPRMTLRAPVTFVDARDAAAFAAWEAGRGGAPWRLPHEFEHEKAARGVDGRRFPWGSTFVTVLANVEGSRAGTPTLEEIDSHPHDVSPYGVVGLAGNVRTWCVNTFVPTMPLPGTRIVVDPKPPLTDAGEAAALSVRGGSYLNGEAASEAASRFGAPPDRRFGVVGIRLARSFPRPPC